MRVLALVVVIAGCYEPPSAPCAIRCSDACPGDLTCNDQGYCVGSAGDVCTTPLVSVRVGAMHACGLDANGNAYCWGDDTNGAVGLGSGAFAVTQPAHVGAGAQWTAIAAGGGHSCGIHDGAVYCWGDNANGEVRGVAGGTQPTPYAVPTSPTTPLPASGFTQVAAGGEHSCAIGDGQLWCWGAADGIGVAKSFMERMDTLDDWIEVSTGQDHVCGISRSAGVVCFGSNDRIQAGQPGAQPVMTPTPVAVSLPVGTPIHVAAGANFNCTIVAAQPADTMGTLWCWGDNGSHQVDPGNTNPQPNAVQVGTAADWTAITAGERRVCGIRGGHAFCWGSTFYGGLGNGVWTVMVDSSAAVDLGPADDIQLGVPPHNAGGDDVGCLIAAGQIRCWGENNHGELGAGIPASEAPTAVEVTSPDGHGWQHVWTGHHHTCATTSGGALYCWGLNDNAQVTGQPGRGDTNTPCIPSEPCDAPLPTAAPVAHADAVAAGDNYACALNGHAITCWGNNDRGTLGTTGDVMTPVPPPSGQQWMTLFGGDRGNCAITDQNRLYCWGIIYNDQTVETPTELADANLANMLDLRFGDNWACGVRSDHARICWGKNDQYQNGDGTMGDVTQPSPFAQLPAITAIAVRNAHACAVSDDPAHPIACWGYGGERETGTATNPAQVPSTVTDQAGGPLSTCTAISTGDGMSCAICNGAPWCWGGDPESELGRGTHVDGQHEHADKVAVPTGITFTDVSSGSNHTCAAGDGRLFCWGWGTHGELGNGAHATNLPALLAPAR